jgi:LCP family protein required for cell wall assembly
MSRRRLVRVTRAAILALVLGVVALVIPDSGVKSTQIALVKVDQANAAAIGPHVISILAVGSDARPGENMIHTRGDALQLVTINTQTHAASIIGVPRDSYDDIPGHGMDKINASLYFGGPQLLGQAVGNLIGVQPKYVFVTRFPYFIAMVKWLGGVKVRNPYAFSDDALKPAGFPAGPIHLGGYDVVAINPNAETVEGDRCYATLAEVPDEIDVVFIGTRPERAVETVQECIDRGVTRVWMHRAFGGGSASPEATALGRAHGITVIDGGCPCMFAPTDDSAHRFMRHVCTWTGKVPRSV